MNKRSEAYRSTLCNGAALVDAHELARSLNIGLSAVWRLRREGCPTIRIGRLLRFDTKVVIDWLAQRQDQSNVATPSTTKPQRRTGRSLPAKNRRVRIVPVEPQR